MSDQIFDVTKNSCFYYNLMGKSFLLAKYDEIDCMGPMFSICIPVINSKYIKECLDHIFKSKFQNFEVLINDSSKDFFVTDIISQYDVKIIKKRTKSFESRMISALGSSGEKILILDDTRLVPDTLLENLENKSEDMLVIGERDIGKGPLIKLSNLDKRAVVKDNTQLNPLKNKNVIPRLYKRDIIVESLNKIKLNLSSDMLNNIVGLDLEIIYFEAFKISQNIGYVLYPEILHYGDENLNSVFRKYYRYGYTQKMLKETTYSELANISGRTRNGYSIGDRILSLPLQVVRGIPFIFGYISGESGIRK